MDPFAPKGIKPLQAKRSKYGNIKTHYMGIKFDSKREFERFLILRDMEKSGKISDLQCQVKFELLPKFKNHGQTVLGVSYIADFVYKRGTDTICEDVKSAGTRTNVAYIIKKKLFMYHYPDHIFFENS